VTQYAGRDGDAGLPQRRADLADLAVFTLDAKGLVTGWPESAARMFGIADHDAEGRHVCEVLLTGPGHSVVAEQALAEVSAGRSWNSTVAGGRLGEGRFAIRCEPLAGPDARPDAGAAVTTWRAWPQPAPGWLTEAAARIGSSLDLTQTADEVAEVAVPAFADAAAIFIAERLLIGGEPEPSLAGSGTAMRRLAARITGQDQAVTAVLAPEGEVIVFGPGTPAAQAVSTGTPVLSDHLDGQTAERISRRPGGPEVVAGYTSFLAMPLAARGTVTGCLLFARTAASPGFTTNEVVLAAELAARAAVCVDNARLYQRERRTALALQRGLLPSQPAIPDDLDVAHHYQPAGAMVIGGDWYDIIPLRGGRAALIVGDAMGHGPEAAAAMVQLRTAAHILAGLELSPGQLLGRLDQIAETITTAPFATCTAAIIDPSARSCTVALAGHPPPITVLADGSTEMRAMPPGLPLGLSAGSFEQTPIQLLPGSTLALYTDGLVEDRHRPIDQGIAALRGALGSALAAPDAPLPAACHAITEALCQHPEDDTTLVLARIRQR
jgi:serine phosphatase RsbU (regulator of sigma subunit)